MFYPIAGQPDGTVYGIDIDVSALIEDFTKRGEFERDE